MKFNQEVERVFNGLEEFKFKFEQNEKVFKQLECNIEQACTDLSQMKDQSAEDKLLFVKNLAEVNDALVWEQKSLREE